MPTIQSMKNALKGRARKSQEPVDESSDKYPDWFTTNEPEPPGESPISLDEAAVEYVMYLKPLYSDVSFDDLTSTLNRLHNKNFRPEDIEAYYMYMCNEMISQKKLRNAGIHQPSPPNMMELDGPLLWLKDTAFHGEENYLHYNRPIITLVGHRRKYEAALAVLKKSSSSDAAVSLPERPADFERLSKPGPVAVEDLRDLRPSDLERIYEMRQKTRGPMLSYWRQERWGGLEG